MFYIFALFSAFINNKSLYEAFGFHGEHPIMIGFLLFSDALAPMDAVVTLLMNILSRKFEFEAVPFGAYKLFAIGKAQNTDLLWQESVDVHTTLPQFLELKKPLP